MYDIRGFQEKLQIWYEMYKDTVEEGHKVLTYVEWLELKYFNLVNQTGKNHLSK